MSLLCVKIYYGPSNTFDGCIHKPQLLAGIRDLLQKRGFRVYFVPVNFINYCMLEMSGHEVFRCNLKYLKFNTYTKRDPVARQAVEAVMTTAVKVRRARACLWFWTALDHQMFRRHKCSPKDYFVPKNLNLDTISCVECVTTCCDNEQTGTATLKEDELRALKAENFRPLRLTDKRLQKYDENEEMENQVAIGLRWFPTARDLK